MDESKTNQKQCVLSQKSIITPTDFIRVTP